MRERNMKMKNRNRGLFTVFTVVLMCCIVCLLPGNVQAASKATKAKKAYASYLVKQQKQVPYLTLKFGLIDINKDGVPELVTTPDNWYNADIYAYVNGKVKCVGWAFSGDCAFYPSRKVYYRHTCHTGVDEYHYYTFNGKKMKEVACKYGSNTVNAVTGKQKEEEDWMNFEPYKYTVKDKVVTEEEYNQYTANLVKNAKKKKPTMRNNTAKNRGKYLSKSSK